MTVHLYALCWNEVDVLEFFFRNYDSWVDRYFIYDDGSTDGSIEILKKHPKVELRSWDRENSCSYNLSQLNWINQVWKESRGKADWVVVPDIDEHLLVPNHAMQDYLQICAGEGVTILPAFGYQMLSESFPAPGDTLCKTLTIGAPFKMMSKTCIFNPNAVEELNSSIGNHSAWPIGRLKLPKQPELLLLHYKYMGFEKTLEKHANLNGRKGSRDISNNWGQHYSWSPEKLKRIWKQFESNAVDISAPLLNSDKIHQYRIWWRPGWKFIVRQFIARILIFSFGGFPHTLMRKTELIIANIFFKSE